ncbi:DedA family protein [Candidatus Amarolinea aalborgensis]|uniref:DedA family protein n=1 Tax=Candidatus Amarolinea aalborgensis TaxID=2249329 RepID=UPI003BFA0510
MIAELETQIVAALQTLFDRFGWFGVAGLMAFENATGITPSEIVLGLAGWLLLAAKNAGFGMVFVGALYAALGSTAGASVTYWLARLGGRPVVDHTARWLRITPYHITRAEAQFRRWGPGVVLFGRLVPGVRTWVTVPAGLARMSYLQFVVFTFAGAYVWSALLIGVGYELGHAWWRMRDFAQQFAPWFLAGLLAVGLLGLMARWLAAQRQRRSALVPVTNEDEKEAHCHLTMKD